VGLRPVPLCRSVKNRPNLDGFDFDVADLVDQPGSVGEIALDDFLSE